MPNLATTGTYRGTPLNEARLLNMRPLTDHWFDEACLTQMSAYPLSPSPTLPCLLSEQGTKAAAEQLTHPAAIENIQIMLLSMVPLLLFGQGNIKTQTAFTCLLHEAISARLGLPRGCQHQARLL